MPPSPPLDPVAFHMACVKKLKTLIVLTTGSDEHAMCLSPAPLPLPGTILEKSLPCFVATFTRIHFSLNVGRSGCLSTCFK